MIINRCHDENILRRCRQFAHNGRKGWQDSCRKKQPVLFDRKAMASAPPVDISIIPLLRQIGIAKHSMIQAFLQSLADLRCCRKVHICDPHRQFIFFYIPFITIGISSVYHLIKIVLHRKPPLFLTYIGLPAILSALYTIPQL